MGKLIKGPERKGDYHRYLAEFATGNDRKEAAENSLVAYKAAGDIAMTELPPTHPMSIGVRYVINVGPVQTLPAMPEGATEHFPTWRFRHLLPAKPALGTQNQFTNSEQWIPNGKPNSPLPKRSTFAVETPQGHHPVQREKEHERSVQKLFFNNLSGLFTLSMLCFTEGKSDYSLVYLAKIQKVKSRIKKRCRMRKTKIKVSGSSGELLSPLSVMHAHIADGGKPAFVPGNTQCKNLPSLDRGYIRVSRYLVTVDLLMLGAFRLPNVDVHLSLLDQSATFGQVLQAVPLQQFLLKYFFMSERCISFHVE
ncbi:hypothetical protein P7K49_010584 [Saguinus oedipus]|uniref:14-3-3 domain-containing protein n=1 Tax=Saguinus oedipus TaxID=9490 RepID=A0ABQ9VN72_SAGOE|nr:hypothetical protein P7K49_010584 [Saguinus oedipus]